MKKVLLLSTLLLGCKPMETSLKPVYDCTQIAPEKQIAFDTRIAECQGNAYSDNSSSRNACVYRVMQTYCKPILAPEKKE